MMMSKMKYYESNERRHERSEVKFKRRGGGGGKDGEGRWAVDG